MSLWPSGFKCAATFCFDLDSDTLWFSGPPYGTTPVQHSRGEYEIYRVLPRILDLLDKYSIKASFFVPGFVIDKYQKDILEIARRGHEIGHHGHNHEKNNTLDEKTEREVLKEGLMAFSRAGLERPVGYRSPAWDFSPSTLRLLLDEGFSYDSSLMGDEIPYVIHSESGESLIELPVEWILDDAPYFLFAFGQKYKTGMSDPEKVFRIWKDEFDGYYHSGSYFNLTMHPQIIGRYHRLKMLEELIVYIKSHEGVYIAPCRDIYGRVKDIL